MDEKKKLSEKIRETETAILEAIDYIIDCLADLNELEAEERLSPELYGRKCGLVEALEKLMEWRGAKEHGFDLDVEREFPI